MHDLKTLLRIKLPIIQAPMAGVQGSRLTIAVANAGGLGSLLRDAKYGNVAHRAAGDQGRDRPTVQREFFLSHPAAGEYRTRIGMTQNPRALLPRIGIE